MSKVLKTAAIVVGAVALVASGVGALGAAGFLGAGIAAGGTIAGIATAATLTTIGTIASVAAGVLSLGAGLTAKKPTAASATGSPTTFSANPDAGIPLVIGRTGTAGDIVLHKGFDSRDEGDNDRKSFVSILSLGPVDAIEGQTVDRAPVSYTATGAAIGAFAGFMWSLTQIGAVPEAQALGFGDGAGTPPEWTTEHKLSGLAAASWTLRFDTKAKQFQNGVPAPMWAVRGDLCYDPTKDSTYPGGSGPHRMADPADTAAYDAARATWEFSENPYLVGLKWAHGHWQRDPSVPGSTYQRVMGFGANWAAIDVGSFVEGRNIAAANGWKVGGVIYSGDGKWDTLKKILQAGMGEPLTLGARVSCFVNAPKVSLATITADDVVGSASVGATQPRRDRINTITPRYRLEANNWQFLPGSPITIPEYVALDRGKRSKVQDYPFIQHTPQIGTAVRYDIENSREFGPIVLPCKLFWMGYKPGDCVTADLPELGLNSQTILLLNRGLDPSTGITTLTARSETTAKHAFALGQTATPPPTPGVTGPPVIPVPGDGDWTIEALDADPNVVSPTLVIAGSVKPNVDGVVFEYREFDSGLPWSVSGSDAPTATNREITGLKTGTAYEAAVSYTLRGFVGNRRVVGPVTTPGIPPRYADGTDIDDWKPAEPGATVGAPAGTIVGGVRNEDGSTTGGIPATDIVQQFGEIPGLVLGAGRSDAAQRAIELAGDRLHEIALRAIAESERGRKILTDAGIVVDPATGKVRVFAVESLADRATTAEITLDAVKGQIAQRVTYNDLNVAITRAVLDPSQLAGFDGITGRLTDVELLIDAIEGEIALRTTTADFGEAVDRITDAEIRLDSVEGEIALKVDSVTFDEVATDVGAIKASLTSLGDVTAFSLDIRQSRAVDPDEGRLRDIIAGEQAGQRRIVQEAAAKLDIYAKIDETNAAEAGQRLALEARVVDVNTRAVTALGLIANESKIRADEFGIVGRQVQALAIADEDQAAAISEAQTAAITAQGGVAGVSTTIRQQIADGEGDAEANLRSLVEGEKGKRRLDAQLVQIQQEFSTTLVANEVASAVARQALFAQLRNAEAAIVTTANVAATANRATADRTSTLESVLYNGATGLAATRSRVQTIEQTINTPTTGYAARITKVESDVNDPTTGLLKTRTRVGTVETAITNPGEATGSRIFSIEAELRDTDTGLPRTRTRVGTVETAITKPGEAVGSRITSIETELADPATGLAQTRARVGTVETAISLPGQATGSRVASIETQVNDPTTGLAKTRSRIKDVEDAINTPTSGYAARIGIVETELVNPVTGLSATRAKVETIEDVVVGPDGGQARAVVELTVNGRVSGTRQTNNGARATFGVAADEFAVFDPDTDERLFHVDENGAIAASFKAGSIGYDNLQMGSAQKVAFQTMPSNVVIAKGATVQVVSLTFIKEDADSILKISFNGDFSSADDLQFTATMAIDGTVIKSTGVNIILVAANAAMPISPYKYATGIAAGQRTVTLAVTNNEADNVGLVIAEGSTLEVVELRKASIGSSTGAGNVVITPPPPPPGDVPGDGGGGYGGPHLIQN